MGDSFRDFPAALLHQRQPAGQIGQGLIHLLEGLFQFRRHGLHRGHRLLQLTHRRFHDGNHIGTPVHDRFQPGQHLRKSGAHRGDGINILVDNGRGLLNQAVRRILSFSQRSADGIHLQSNAGCTAVRIVQQPGQHGLQP